MTTEARYRDQRTRRGRNCHLALEDEDCNKKQHFVVTQETHTRRKKDRMSKKKNKKKTSFKGYDWIEIFEYFDLEYFDLEEEEDMLERFRTYIWSFWTWRDNKEGLGGEYKFPKKIVDPCRKFVKAVAKESYKINYCGPLWSGLYDIENDETFMKYFTELLGHLWT